MKSNVKSISNKLLAVFTAIMLASLTATVACAANAGTPNANSGNLATDVLTIVMWLVRAIVVVKGFIPPLLSFVDARANDDSKAQKDALSSMVIVAVVIAVTFPIENLVASYIS